MITYLKMKHNELKVKAAFYKMAADVIDSRKEALDLFRKLFAALKDVPAEELRTELVTQLAGMIRSESKGGTGSSTPAP